MFCVYRRSLRLRLLAFVGVIVLLFAGSLYLFSTIEQSFSSRSLERQVVLYVDTPRQYSVEQTAAVYAELYRKLDQRRAELDIADISYSYSRSTGRSRGGFGRSRRMSIHLVDEEDGRLTTLEAREKIRALLPVKAGVDLRIATSRGHGGGGGVEIQLMGDDLAVLALISESVVERLESIPTIRDVDTSLESGDEEIHVRPWCRRGTSEIISSVLRVILFSGDYGNYYKC